MDLQIKSEPQAIGSHPYGLPPLTGDLWVALRMLATLIIFYYDGLSRILRKISAILFNLYAMQSIKG